ncbi:Gfo/Idh/MocA family oxidoreductase [Subtercola sp. RTI3]|uniref:Gfo/Idh/MocA family protein n=1 Tax=Subtercola sp. RTI3 TaxID=3048639 RepID=UPI002B2250C1|nr:Gfo/Idh/MocA family oxidoreductase [Subtercola sp. RTI3]MEA9983963.1 Gfo/Idh/MocA family oxidoreductase [Subtercola sp. RTI3]
MNTASRPLKVAVMSFAHTHARGYVELLLQNRSVSVLTSDPGIHSPAETRGRTLADELGVDYVHTYDELLAWQPDAVIVTSENAHHREHVELAARAGAHILCEKPLATTLADGEAMLAATQAAGVILMVAFPVRFASTFLHLKTDYDAGALGDVFSVRGSNNGKLPSAREWFTDPALSGGGALVDHVVHIADLLEALMHAAPLSVTAVANQKLHADRAKAETAGLVSISYDNGVIAAIDCSWSRAETAPTWGGVRLSVAGTRGTVDVDFFGPRVHGLDSASGVPLELPYGPDFDAALLSTFLEAVGTGVQPQPDGAVGLRTLKIVLAAQESVATGRTVQIVEG